MTQDVSRIPVKPFLIKKDSEGQVRLTVRTTHHNSWNYPIVTSSVVDEAFATMAAARAYARKHLGAETDQFASE